ncbi:MAG: hypothetical protein NTU88_04315, partial [Armatimonadetes bacterium]|nr:hypothetical protein [Armatimonadota bacterium]
MRPALGIGVVLVLSFLLSMHLLPDKISWHIGDISPEEIRAHRTVRYKDSVETERLRGEAAARADKVYKIVPNAASEAIASVSNVFDIIRRARINGNLPSVNTKADFVRRSLSLELSKDDLAALLTV